MASDPLRPLLHPLRIAATGLSAERARMDVIAENIANAHTTRTAEGGPYRRRTVVLEALPGEAVRSFQAMLRQPHLSVADPAHFRTGLPGPDGVPTGGGVRVAAVVEDPSEGALVYQPGHPDADEAGYVRLPNVDLTIEMVDLMHARRLYEANATVFEAMKNVLRRATEL
jgi:flagellar basal-body rod protein FlgC